jgi:hypothetical protein
MVTDITNLELFPYFIHGSERKYSLTIAMKYLILPDKMHLRVGSFKPQNEGKVICEHDTWESMLLLSNIALSKYEYIQRKRGVCFMHRRIDINK